MWPYYVIFSFITISSIVSLFLSKTNEKKLFFSLVLLLAIFAAIRYQTGYDWDYYVSNFLKSDWQYIWGNLNVEPLFVFLGILVKAIGGNFFILSIILTLTAFLLKSNFIFKYSKLPVFSLFLLFPIYLKYDMGMIRQGVSIGLLLYSLPFVFKRNFVIYFIIVIIASSMHFSSILFIPVYFLINFKLTFRVVIISMMSALLIDFLLRTNTLPYIFNFGFDHIQHKFQAYYSPDSKYSFEFYTFYWRLFIFVLFFYMSMKNDNQEIKLFTKIYFLGFLFFIIFASIPNLAERGSLYFKIFEIILIPHLFIYFKNDFHKILSISILIISIAYFSRHFNNLMSEKYRHNFIPYRTFLQNND